MPFVSFHMPLREQFNSSPPFQSIFIKLIAKGKKAGVLRRRQPLGQEADHFAVFPFFFLFFYFPYLSVFDSNGLGISSFVCLCNRRMKKRKDETSFCFCCCFYCWCCPPPYSAYLSCPIPIPSLSPYQFLFSIALFLSLPFSYLITPPRHSKHTFSPSFSFSISCWT